MWSYFKGHCRLSSQWRPHSYPSSFSWWCGHPDKWAPHLDNDKWLLWEGEQECTSKKGERSCPNTNKNWGLPHVCLWVLVESIKVRWKEGHKIGRWCWKSPNFAIFLKSGYSKLNSCYGALMRLGDCGKAWGHCPLTLIERAQWFNFLNPLLDPCPPVQSLGSQVV